MNHIYRIYSTARTVDDVSALRLVGVGVQEVELVLRVHDIVPHATAGDGDGDDDDGDDDDAVSGDGVDAACDRRR